MIRIMSRNWHRRVAIWMVIVVGVTALGLQTALWLGASRPGGSYRVAGLEATLAIRFDRRLRPWVQAESLHDALLAQGWLHARYRLWQMELLRRAGRGRLSAALGEGLLESDRALWRAGVPQLAGRLEADASPTLRRQVDAYVAGVNGALNAMRARPPEFWLLNLHVEPWSRRDVFAVGALIAFQSANNQDNELLRLALAGALDTERFQLFLPDEARLPDFPYIIGGGRPPRFAVTDALDSLAVYLMPSASLGSNGWAIAPWRSATGQALFAFDSHDDLSLPNLFYELHLFHGPGQSLRGWSLPGLPGVINGFNEHLAWGLTNIGDTQDLFLETRHPEDAGLFEMDGAWYRARTETVEIPVKGRSEPEQLTIVHTRHGPLISDEPPLSLRWTGHDLQGRGLEALLSMNTAATLAEFRDALERHGAPTANVTYADRDGHILFRTIGLLPVRGAGEGLVPLPGNRSDYGWQGLVENARMPLLLDPPSGFVAAANARVHSGPPLVSADNAAGYRMRRLRELLSARTDFRLDDMQAMQLDFHNSQAELLLPHLLPALDGFAEASIRHAAAILVRWADEPRNSADSAGALLWEHWYPELARSIFGEALEPGLLERLMRHNYVLNHALDRLIIAEPESPWWRGQREHILRDSFRRVVAQLTEAVSENPDQWRWDAVQSVHFRHELDTALPLLDRWLSRGPLRWAGGHPVLGRARYRYDRPFEGRSGATVRAVARLGSEPEVRSIIPGGQHGHPYSQYYDDQLQAWLKGELDTLVNPSGSVEVPTTRLLPEN